MDVFIKSFGRPFYLERCIRSLRRFLKGDYAITVLDDGTPLKYLTRIKTEFPGIRIITSPLYDQKTAAINRHLKGKVPYNIKDIPVTFWRHHIGEGSDPFLLLEEDAWLTGDIDSIEIAEVMRTQNVVMTKIYWGGSDRMIHGRREKINDRMSAIIPALPMRSLAIMTPFLWNIFKIRSIMLRTHLVRPDHLLPYYALYQVTSAFFRRDYWRYVWHDALDRVRETDQLLNALRWYHKFPDSRFACLNEEKAFTTYSSSAVNNIQDNDFDMLRFNQILNEAWYEGRLNALENFPNDFNRGYLAEFIPKQTPGCSAQLWQLWIAGFKAPYQQMGIRTEFMKQ